MVNKIILIVMLLAPFQLKAASDTTILHALKRSRASLYYPLSVRQFYNTNGHKLAWIKPDTTKTHTWDAMLLLDCVKQYGLNHEDYHPKQLIYPELHNLIRQYKNDDATALYDIFLTDAIIRFINDLHFGKLNPVYTMTRIDKGLKFNAVNTLVEALNSADFVGIISSTQPKSKQYANLQDYMRLLVGQRSGDCYVIPPELIRKIAINMERLRWTSTTKIRTHLTLTVKDGAVNYHSNNRHQDEQLEKRLYNQFYPPTMKGIIAPYKL